jgi:multidrug efflux system membrane fusion protein
VVFTVAEDSIPQIQQRLRKGNRLVVEAYDRSETEKLGTGTLLTIDNEINTTTGTVKLKAIFNNNNDALFPNQFVNARLLVNVQRGVILIPTAAIQRNTQGAFVYVIKPDQTASMQTVSVGTIDGNTAAVEGLNEGDVVAVDGFDKLQNGVKVVARSAPDTITRSTPQ